MDDIALLAEVLSLVRTDGHGAVAAYISLEERERVAASDNSCALVMQQCRRIAFQDGDIVTEALQG